MHNGTRDRKIANQIQSVAKNSAKFKFQFHHFLHAVTNYRRQRQKRKAHKEKYIV